MASRRKPIVYISSTYTDLKEHRAALKVALEKAGCDVESMERYPAFDQRPLDKCLYDVANCDAYVLVIARRYGYKPNAADGRELSITEREYHEACRTARPCLAFCVSDSYVWPPAATDAPDSPDGLRVAGLRDLVKARHGVGFFTTPDDLAKQVLTALLARKLTGDLFEFPSAADLDRLRSVATRLLDVGRRRAKMPTFTAPLRLSAFEDSDSNEPKSITMQEIGTRAESGESFVLFGDGGVGKTTFLLSLASSCLQQSVKRIPLYLDAALWARSSKTIFEFLADTPAVQSQAMTATELAQFAELGHATFLVNGWNEIPANRKLLCSESMDQLNASGVIPMLVASRARNDAPRLPAARLIEVRGLSWKGQSEVVRLELTAEAASAVLELLARNTPLRHAARSPLILRGLIVSSSTAIRNLSVYDLLGGAVRAFESEATREATLSEPPLYGVQTHFLEALATSLTAQATTTLPREDVLLVLHETVKALAARGLCGSAPAPEVLEALCVRHLVQLEDGLVRFSHQRFQEYFAASAVQRDRSLLQAAVNLPAWDEALYLVAGKLKLAAAPSPERRGLIETASAVAIGLACDLAGRAGFSEADDPSLHRSMVEKLRRLESTLVGDITELATTFEVDSRFTAFNSHLWTLLESESQQVRLHTFRLGGSGITLTQLGADSKVRVAQWSSNRRAEFVHEMAASSENYDYVVDLAFRDPDSRVQIAAISSLFWHYPASGAPVRAWLAASTAVQVDGQLLNHIEDAVDDEQVGTDVIRRIRELSSIDIPKEAKIRLAIAFPKEMAESTLDLLLEELRSNDRHRSDSPLIAIARTRAPGRLLDLAADVILGTRSVPDWAEEFVQVAPAQVRAAVFERAWAMVQSESPQHASATTVGPLADRSQTKRTLEAVLHDVGSRPANPTPLEDERRRQRRYLLANAKGQDLLAVVMERGASASYEEACELVRVITGRMGLDVSGSRERYPWAPTVAEVHDLVALFATKQENAQVPHDQLFALLGAIGCKVSAESFSTMLIEVTRRQLDAWSTFQQAAESWRKNGGRGQRPTNPYWGRYLNESAALCGPSIVPRLIGLMAHPASLQVVPEMIARALNNFWGDHSWNSHGGVASDMVEGARRRELNRVLMQPDDIYQGITDEAARELSQHLNETLDRLKQRQASDSTFNIHQANFGVRSLLGILSRIPSRDGEVAVLRALASGFADKYAVIYALRALVRSGRHIVEPSVVTQLEAVYANVTGNWIPQNEHYIVAELCQLMFCVKAPAVLSRPLESYIEEWWRVSYEGEVVRSLARVPMDSAWDILWTLARKALANRQPAGELLAALGAALNADRLSRFCQLLREDSLSSWHPQPRTLDGVVQQVAAALGKDTSRLQWFQAECREINSAASWALGLMVLASISGAEATCLDLAVSALDSEHLSNPNSSIYHTFLDIFASKVPFDRPGQYQIVSTAANALRAEIYRRASQSGPRSAICRRLLATIERMRIQYGRPIDEYRHLSMGTVTGEVSRVFGQGL